MAHKYTRAHANTNVTQIHIAHANIDGTQIPMAHNYTQNTRTLMANKYTQNTQTQTHKYTRNTQTQTHKYTRAYRKMLTILSIFLFPLEVAKRTWKKKNREKKKSIDRREISREKGEDEIGGKIRRWKLIRKMVRNEGKKERVNEREWRKQKQGKSRRG